MRKSRRQLRALPFEGGAQKPPAVDSQDHGIADRLLSDLESLDWSESIKVMQRNWIGRSEGANVMFDLADSAATGEGFSDGKGRIEVYTTRPDTLSAQPTWCWLPSIRSWKKSRCRNKRRLSLHT